MSSTFSDGQLRQTGNSLAAAGWTTEDLTLLGQAGRDRLVGIRDSLRRGGDIVTAIVEGRTELWLHEDQKTGWTRGRVIYSHLQETGLLAGCVDLDELKAIQTKGIDFFRKHFAGKAIFGWRSVRDGHVPFLVEYGDGVLLFWRRLGDVWVACYPALRRK
ncbi:MAG: hypothetical protein P4L63_02580 [Candidatus Pacebacteria bacterium]|nr:hypothetical protein [Candidatus Paceibacterota bacterium]